jgi:hypothetical protein
VHGHLDRGAGTGTFAADKRGHDRSGSNLAGYMVANEPWCLSRHVIPALGETGDTGHGLHNRVILRSAATRPAGRKSGDHAMHQVSLLSPDS